MQPLRKHAHAIYRNFLGCKNENFHQKSFDIFLTFAQNIDGGYTLEPPRRGGSNEYPQSMFWTQNKKNRHFLHTPVLLYKMWFKGVFISRTCFPDGYDNGQNAQIVKKPIFTVEHLRIVNHRLWFIIG